MELLLLESLKVVIGGDCSLNMLNDPVRFLNTPVTCLCHWLNRNEVPTYFLTIVTSMVL